MQKNQQSTIASDYTYCEDIIKNHSKNIYYALSNLPKDKAQAVYAIYAFCRIAEDCVLKNRTSSLQFAALDQLANELDRFAAGQEADRPLWRALREVFNRFTMDIQPFYEQLTGQRMSIYFKTPSNLRSLEVYSKYAAGSVGKMMLPIIAGSATSDLNDAAEDLGIAMQLTHILRNVGKDYREKGRIYLPKEEMERYGYSELSLSEGQITKSFVEMWEHLAQHAEFLYDNVAQRIGEIDEDSRFAVLLSVHVCQGILNSVRKRGYDCINHKNYVSTVEIAKLVSERGYQL
ncbi:phytoene synthase [Sporosarcina sp. P37]|uniref:phytoene/squalene synthase family protein n=1 Tax=unclassified Sporosarcina TaxID=2647733 RepID=UPI0009BD36D5|nr:MULTISPECIES: phytoene/squalene synthase family protein [unclassified Sporosarcina]ARD49691.1 phytoene synthase [Sporosarcina sp. P33]ARK26253.1 phytoene synthase [Sporosarcina sp. P37]PID20089.1 phytoene/squalene synthase family protein [Sporosarcina sp. P35]